MKTILILFVFFSVAASVFSSEIDESDFRTIDKRALQKSHEKSESEKWQDKFLNQNREFDQASSLVNLVNKIAVEYLSDCTPIILYDIFTESSGDLVLQQLFRTFPIAYVHGQITDNYRIKVERLSKNTDTCSSYILFMKDVMRCKDVIGDQSNSKVVAIARSSQWRVYEFLSNEVSQGFMNLLVIAKSEKIQSSTVELPYILYTHNLYVDALGSSTHEVLTSWRDGKLTRPHVSLFPKKIRASFAGHRFIISLAHQPPFVIKKGRDDNDDLQWDGSELRLIELLSKMYNFTTDFREPKNVDVLGPAEAVTKAIKDRKANLGIAGLYATDKRLEVTDTSVLHSQDCAAFISLTSTALPRYRAIMGPFHWSVWLALIFVYLFAIFPLTFSDKHTLRNLIEKPEEVENMFWYVFGTFTNCFTFTGKGSWSHSNKMATRLFIGFYWVFTIIITACYTGSIIAFVTIPVYPATIDTAQELLHGRYQIGTLDKGGWQYWFENSTDPITTQLLKNVEYVSDVESGLRNTTKAFFWAYAFLGSRAQLDYIVRTNFTTTKKRSLLHISAECFVPYGVSVIYSKNSIYSQIIDIGILKIVQHGFMIKFKNDIEWLMMRSATGKLLAANSFGNAISALNVEDKALTLDDTQGMFLLLAIGFVVAGASLLSEWFGGCVRICQRRRRAVSADSVTSHHRSFDVPTPREKLDSIQYNSVNLAENLIEEEHFFDHSADNYPNCIVHNNNVHDQGNSNDAENHDSDDIEDEINKLFNFDDLFGDNNHSVDETKTEDIVEENEEK